MGGCASDHLKLATVFAVVLHSPGVQPEPGKDQQITLLLKAWREGQAKALDELIAMVYPTLRSLASRYLTGERPGHTLNATGLVHEAYLKMLGLDVGWEDRVHFFAVSARVMRHILVDHAKANRREKRGGDARQITLDDAAVVSAEPEERLLDLDRALQDLAAVDSRKAEIIELTYFGGMTQPEVAAALKVSETTVQRDLRMARAWLHRELNQSPQ